MHQICYEKSKDCANEFQKHVTSTWNQRLGGNITNKWNVTWDSAAKQFDYPKLNGKDARQLGMSMEGICEYFKTAKIERPVWDEVNPTLKSERPYLDFGKSVSRIVELSHGTRIKTDNEVLEYDENCLTASWIFHRLFSKRKKPSIHFMLQTSPIFMKKWKTIGRMNTEGFESSNSSMERVDEICGGGFGSSKYVQRLKYQVRQLFQLKFGYLCQFFETFWKKRKRNKKRMRDGENEEKRKKPKNC